MKMFFFGGINIELLAFILYIYAGIVILLIAQLYFDGVLKYKAAAGVGMVYDNHDEEV